MFKPGQAHSSWLVQVNECGETAVYRLGADGVPVTFAAGTAVETMVGPIREAIPTARFLTYPRRRSYGPEGDHPYNWGFVQHERWADVLLDLATQAGPAKGHTARSRWTTVAFDVLLNVGLPVEEMVEERYMGGRRVFALTERATLFDSTHPDTG